MRPYTTLLLATLLAAVPRPARAQTAYSLDFGAITAFDDATIQIGFRAAPALAERGGAEIMLATFPDALVHGVVLLMLDVDVTYGARVSEQVTLFPRAGGSVIAGAGEGGGGGAFGYNAGVGLLGRASRTLGVRIDYTHRRFVGGSETAPLSSVTVGIVWIY